MHSHHLTNLRVDKPDFIGPQEQADVNKHLIKENMVVRTSVIDGCGVEKSMLGIGSSSCAGGHLPIETKRINAKLKERYLWHKARHDGNRELRK